MIKKIINKLKKIIFGISNDELSLQANIKEGMKVGKNVYGLVNCTIDHGHCWLIAVSYTHLDVYKRQSLLFVLILKQPVVI